MADIILFGEPMVMFLADQQGPLDEAHSFQRYLAGAEVNVSIGLSRLGYQVAYATKLGADPLGKYIYRSLEEADISTKYITMDTAYPTGFQMKGIRYGGDAEVVYYRKNSAASTISAADVDGMDFTGVRHVHLTGIPPALSRSAREASFRMLEKARQIGASVSFDPNLRPGLWNSQEEMVAVINQLACQCDMVLPGISEGVLLTGKETPEAIAAFYLEQGVSSVVVKLGPDGAYFQNQKTAFYQSSWPVKEIVDTVGAGDGFAVGIVSGFLEGLTNQDMVKRGNIIGALQLTVLGDNEGLPTRSQLEQIGLQPLASGA